MLQKVLRRRDLTGPELDLRKKPAASRSPDAAHFRDLGMFTGSGAIEGGIKAIVVQRAKQAGMHWSVSGAASILALRTQHASGRWNDFVAPEHTPPAGLRTAV